MQSLFTEVRHASPSKISRGVAKLLATNDKRIFLVIQSVSHIQSRELLCSPLRNWGCCSLKNFLPTVPEPHGTYLERCGTLERFLERTWNFWNIFWNIFGTYLERFWNVPGTLESFWKFLERTWNAKLSSESHQSLSFLDDETSRRNQFCAGFVIDNHGMIDPFTGPDDSHQARNMNMLTPALLHTKG